MRLTLDKVLKQGFYVPLPDKKVNTVIRGSRRFDNIILSESGPGSEGAIDLDNNQAHLLQVMDGRIRFSSGLDTLLPFAALYLPLGAAEQAEPKADDAHYFHVAIEPELLDAFSVYADPPGIMAEHGIGIVAKLVMKMFYEFRHDDQFTALDCHCLLFELLAQICRVEIAEGKQKPEWLNEAKTFIHENYMEPIRLDDVARYVDVDRLELSKTFRTFQNMNLSLYIRRLRIHRACYLLRNGASNLSEMAQDLGFVDQSHFTKVFKLFVGSTPGSYQRECK